MTYEHNRSESEVLSETNIDFYGNPDVRFHINTGRNFESNKTIEYDEGNKIEKKTVNTTPCPTVDVYDINNNLEVIVHLPVGNPIIIDWFTVENEYESFFEAFVNGLENGYKGIEEVTSFDIKNSSEQLGSIIRTAIESNTPDSVKIPRAAE